MFSSSQLLKSSAQRTTFQFLFALAVLFTTFIGCKKVDIPTPGPGELSLKEIASGLVSPIALASPNDGTHRLFVVDQVGKIWIIDKDGKMMPDPFIDVSSKLIGLNPGYDERGLLGLAFHPSYKTNGRFYLFYTAPPPPGGPTTDAGNTGLPKVWNNTTTISEFRVSANPNKASLASEKIILWEAHPQGNHNGGTIEFGHDGYLYISIGDGGNKNDLGPGHVEDWYAPNAGGNGQDIEQNFMGSILRINVDRGSAGKTYSIPNDNPFVGKPGLDEVYAYGFRNPYRFSFDMQGSRRLFVGDAGQKLYEEISVVEKGKNYGWNVKEGTACFDASDEFDELPNCPTMDIYGNWLMDPVIEAPNAANPEGGNFIVIVAGNVYRGHSIPGLHGKYIFANFSSMVPQPMGEIYMSHPAGPGPWDYEKLEFKNYPKEHIGYYVKGFGQDQEGEVYVLGTTVLGPTGNSGKVFKIVAEKNNGHK